MKLKLSDNHEKPLRRIKQLALEIGLDRKDQASVYLLLFTEIYFAGIDSTAKLYDEVEKLCIRIQEVAEADFGKRNNVGIQ